MAQAFQVPTGSMADTLRTGDRVLVNKFVYHLRGIDRGDIVVFSGTGSWGPAPSPPASPFARWYRDALTAAGLASNGTDYIKRVIGLPGGSCGLLRCGRAHHRQRDPAERGGLSVPR